MTYFTNSVEQQSLKNSYLAMGVLAIILFIFAIAAVILWAKGMQGENGASIFLGVAGFVSLVYVVLTGVWWFGMWDQSLVT